MSDEDNRTPIDPAAENSHTSPTGEGSNNATSFAAKAVSPIDLGGELYKYLGEGLFQFASQKKPCFLLYLNPLSWVWSMERSNGDGVAACFATTAEKQAAITELTGFAPPPKYTPDMLNKAAAAMTRAGALAMTNVAGRLQLAIGGAGAVTLASDATLMMSRAVMLLSRAVALHPIGAAITVLTIAYYANGGRLKLPRVPMALSVPLSKIQGSFQNLYPDAKTANLPIRGRLTADDEYISLELESSELSYEIPVLHPERNPETGLDEITVPATANTPEYTIQITPVAPSSTGNQEPVPVLPNHTGSDIEVVEGPMVITTPAADSDGWQDFIYWRPDAKGTGLEPVYVMTVSVIETKRQQRLDELAEVFDKNKPTQTLTIEGETLKQEPESNRYGTTKIFDSTQLTDKQIFDYAQELAGSKKLTEVNPGIYKAKLKDGTIITLRNRSSSNKNVRWTIDIDHSKRLAKVANKYGFHVEIKLK
jgi:hypothetical protein